MMDRFKGQREGEERERERKKERERDLKNADREIKSLREKETERGRERLEE